MKFIPTFQLQRVLFAAAGFGLLAGCSMFDHQQTTTYSAAQTSAMQPEGKPAVNRYANDMLWIKSQNPNQYTLQIFQSSSASAIEAFNQKFEGSTTVYRYYAYGNPAYGVIYGQFVSLDAAKQAIPRLPGKVHAQVKSFGQIQSVLMD